MDFDEEDFDLNTAPGKEVRHVEYSPRETKRHYETKAIPTEIAPGAIDPWDFEAKSKLSEQARVAKNKPRKSSMIEHRPVAFIKPLAISHFDEASHPTPKVFDLDVESYETQMDKSVKQAKTRQASEYHRGSTSRYEALDMWANAPKLDIQNLPQGFCHTPLNPNWGKVRMYISRDRSRYMKKLSAVYSIYIGDFAHTKGQVALYARRTVSLGTPHYVFSTNRDDIYRARNFRSTGYMGKLRGNNKNKCYSVYDKGVCTDEREMNEFTQRYFPDKEMTESTSYDENIRKCLACVLFKDEVQGIGKDMEVAIPQILPHTNVPFEWTDETIPDLDHEPLQNVFKRIRHSQTQNLSKSDKMICFQTVDESMNTDALDTTIHHKSKMKSIKNFQLVKTISPETSSFELNSFSKRVETIRTINSRDIVLQMDKVSSTVYNIDVKHPFSIAQTLAICLTRFDGKY